MNGVDRRSRVLQAAAVLAAVLTAGGRISVALADVAVIPSPSSFVGVFAVVALACGALLVVVLAVIALVLLRHLRKTRISEASAVAEPVAGAGQQSAVHAEEPPTTSDPPQPPA